MKKIKIKRAQLYNLILSPIIVNVRSKSILVDTTDTTTIIQRIG